MCVILYENIQIVNKKFNNQPTNNCNTDIIILFKL